MQIEIRSKFYFIFFGFLLYAEFYFRIDGVFVFGKWGQTKKNSKGEAVFN